MTDPTDNLGLPDFIRAGSGADVAAQLIPWERNDAWAAIFTGHDDTFDALRSHAAQTNGYIARSFVHDLANGDPIDLFLVTMAWGWGNIPIGPSRVRKILAEPDVTDNVTAVVDTVRTNGAGDGWTAPLATHKTRGLGMAYGTKLLYFAGYQHGRHPRPLILDARVRRCLHYIAPDILPAPGKTIYRADYERYVELAERWAADPSWNQEPDVVEYCLFAGGGTRPDQDAETLDDDAQP